MDDASALIAREVAMAASAWHHCVSDTEAYRRLLQAVERWDNYIAPPLVPASNDVVTQVRKAARDALYGLDETQAECAGNLAMAALGWLQNPTSHQAYRSFIDAVQSWDNYITPRLDAGADELLDELGDDSGPVTLGSLLSGAIEDTESVTLAINRLRDH